MAERVMFWLQSVALTTLTVCFVWQMTAITWLAIVVGVLCCVMVLLVYRYGGAFPRHTSESEE